MNFRRLGLVMLAVVLGVGTATTASAQVSVYADFSASKLTGGIGTQVTHVLYGPTLGITAQVASKKHFKLSADIRANLYGRDLKPFAGVAIGPKFDIPIRGKYAAYGEFMVGFARYNDGMQTASSASTDSQVELNFGLDRRVTQKFDWRVFEYGYTQYYGLGGAFNPKTFSTGVVFHIGAR